MSKFYPFILMMWTMGSYDAAKVQSYVPKYISQTECDAIILVPQDSSVNDPLSVKSKETM